MSTTNDKVTITLTDERPVRLSKNNWPLVAKANEALDHNNQELFRRYYLRVRLHAVETTDEERAIQYHGGQDGPLLAAHSDKRAVVYGWYESSYQGESGKQSGFKCALDECAETIRRVGEAIGADESLIMECIGDLPPVEEAAEPALKYTAKEGPDGWYIMLGDRAVARGAGKPDVIMLVECANASL